MLYNYIKGDIMFGLYIHIPFCRHICHYCDFYKMVVSDKFKEKIIDSIIKEYNQRDFDKNKVETIYIGGGTPSSLPYYILEKLLSNLNMKIDLSSLKEFTVELNPEDINEELVSILSKYHVTRVSIGIQSFNKNIIDRLGRFHFVTEDEIKSKIQILNNHNITNINLDLIYAVPGEIVEDVIKDLEIINRLNITHVSTYSLILEEHTVFNYLYNKGQIELINDELDYQMYNKVRIMLSEFGFKQYEISNFAKPGFESLHNTNYWLNGEYLGIGPAASSHIGNTRFTNIKNANKYIDGVNQNNYLYEEYYENELVDIYEEELMMGLRLIRGININSFKEKFNIDLFKVYPKINDLLKDGLLEIENNNLRIPSIHTYITNFILVKIFE